MAMFLSTVSYETDTRFITYLLLRNNFPPNLMDYKLSRAVFNLNQNIILLNKNMKNDYVV